MWDDDENFDERLEHILGTTAHLLAQMSDQQSSLLLEDVERLALEWEFRGQYQENAWTMGSEPTELQEPVFYLGVQPYLVQRFTEEVLMRILPIIRDVARR